LPSDTGTPSSPFLERKLATILSADVAEFSRLMSEDEEQTLRTFRGHKQVFESVVAMHNGRVFNTAGDAILAEFKSAVEAVRCATDIQTALRTRNDQLPPNRQVRFRIGVNLGDVLVQGQDLLGDGVNVAARLQTAAEPGGVCISGSVHEQIRNKLSLTFQSLGERSYKNIAQPVRTFSVIESEGGVVLPSPKAPESPRVAKTVGIAAAIVVLVAGSYWAYTKIALNNPQPPQEQLTTAQSQPNTPAAQPSVDNPPASTAALNPAPVPGSVPSGLAPAAKPAGTAHKPTLTPAAPRDAQAIPAAPVPSSASRASAVPTQVPARGPYDGAFEGQVCLEATPKEAERCFHGMAIVAGNRISGKWPMGRDTGVTMFLAGDVSPAGDVKMQMHSEKADGSRIITANFTGWIHDNNLDATGKLLMGRGAFLRWHRNAHPSMAPANPS